MRKDYYALAIFVAVVDAGSFAAAGRRIKLSTSVVSHHISSLEERLGVSLFYRSSRKLSLTMEGKAVLQSARHMVDAANKAMDSVIDASAEPAGSLRIALPAFGIHTNLYQSIWSFKKKYPRVSLFVSSSDEQIDLIEHSFDIAVRIGKLPDSSLISKRICPFYRVLVASPNYLATKPKVSSIQELKELEFIAISRLSPDITLTRNGHETSFEPKNITVEVDSISTAKSAVLSGLGVQHLPDKEVEHELATGELVEVLPEWQLPVLSIYIVWPENGTQKKLTRHLIEHLSH